MLGTASGSLHSTINVHFGLLHVVKVETWLEVIRDGLSEYLVFASEEIWTGFEIMVSTYSVHMLRMRCVTV